MTFKAHALLASKMKKRVLGPVSPCYCCAKSYYPDVLHFSFIWVLLDPQNPVKGLGLNNLQISNFINNEKYRLMMLK